VRRTLLLALLVAQQSTPQCNQSASTVAGPAQNIQAIVVNAGPTNNYFNGAFTSVTICAPGQSTACQTIDGVLVDTGSTGLRVLASALSLSLRQQTAANGASIVECAQFLDGFTWGPVQAADVRLAGEQASSVPIQVISESAFPNIPADCTNSGTAENTLASLGANGILGIGLFRHDCGSACAFVGSANPGLYYACSASGCQPTAVALINQVQNPVALFPADNNGILIQLPTVPIGGAVSAWRNALTMESVFFMSWPALSARSEEAWMAGPSAIGSVNGMPSSMMSAPAGGSARSISSEVARSGSPAVTKVTSAARPSRLSAAQRCSIRVVMLCAV